MPGLNRTRAPESFPLPPTATISASPRCRGTRDEVVMPPLDELAPGFWRFTATRNGLPQTMTAYVDGELRVWPRQRELERRRTRYEQCFLPTLDALTRLDVERVLVTHGEPVLRDGGRALAESLARPPWKRASLY
jgi:hypothetical protein